MVKKLLSIFALSVIGLCAYAGQETVLWQSEEEDGTLVGWGEPCLAMSAEGVQYQIAPGDYLKMVVSGVTEGGWPQVALFPQYGGWPPLCNEGVGSKDAYPYTVTFPVTYEIYTTISTEGVSFSGSGAYVSKVILEKGEVAIGPFTVWFGNKACGWGNGVFLQASLFADIEVNGKISYWTHNDSFQILLGGWDGLNVPAYDGNIANKETVDGVTTVTFIQEYAENTTYGEGEDAKEMNVFDLIKENGIGMHGPTILTRIDYIPGRLINAIGEEGVEVIYADIDKVGELSSTMQEFVNGMKESFPGYLVLKAEEIAQINAEIKTLNEKVMKAINAVYGGNAYDGPATGEFATVTEKILALVAGADEAIAAIQAAYEENEAQINDLANAMQELNNKVAEEFPGYAVLKAEEIAALTATIEDLNERLSVAQEAAFETGVYEGIPTGDITAANEELLALVADEAEALVAIQNDYENAVALANEFALNLADFNAELDENFPGFANLHEADLIKLQQAAVDMAQACETALGEAQNVTGVYVIPVEIRTANEELLALVADEAEALVAIQNDYDNAVALANEFALNLADFNAELDENFPGFANLREADLIKLQQAAVDMAQACETALGEAQNVTGVYVIPVEIRTANEELLALVADEAEALVAIQNDYENAVGLANEFALNLAELNETIDTEFPAFGNIHEEELIKLQQAAVDMAQACETALGEAQNETGEYIIPAEIRTAYQELTNIVEAYNEAFAAIETAAEEDVNKLAAIADELEPILDEFDSRYGAACELMDKLYEYFEEVNYAMQEAYNVTGEYVSPLNDEILAELEEELVRIQETTGINGIVVGSEDVYYDLNGNRVANPANGKVYIKVTDGKATKVLKK